MAIREYFSCSLIAFIVYSTSATTRSFLLRAAQSLILGLRLHYVMKPFAGSFQKLYCLSQFADWKRRSGGSHALTGYTRRFELYADVIKAEKIGPMDYLEFGVSKGDSLRWWLQQAAHPGARFYGFDTFEGIPESWGTKEKGSYTNNGRVPEVNDVRCTFVKGLFQDTLLPFLEKQQLNRRLILHFDADLYSATLFCLFTLGPRLKHGDLLIFDEFDVTTHEFRAFTDYSAATGLKYLCIGESNNYNKVVLKIQ